MHPVHTTIRPSPEPREVAAAPPVPVQPPASPCSQLRLGGLPLAATRPEAPVGAPPARRRPLLQRLVPSLRAIGGGRALSSRTPLQRQVGTSGLDNIKALIYKGTGSASQIATDFYQADTPGVDGDFTVGTQAKVKAAAKHLGYPETQATRVSSNNPYQEGDIAGETKWPDPSDEAKGHVESFDFYRVADPRGHTVSLHQLHFENTFADDGASVFSFNARNPALSTFFASTVVTKQREWIRGQRRVTAALWDTPDITTVTRENVVSANGTLWRTTHAPDFDVDLGDVALQAFLTETDNGKSTVSMLQGSGRKVISGRMVRYEPPGDVKWSMVLTTGPA